MKLAFNSSQRNFIRIAKNLRVGISLESLDVSFAYIFPINNASQDNLDDDSDDDVDLSEDPEQGNLIHKVHIILIVW